MSDKKELASEKVLKAPASRFSYIEGSTIRETTLTDKPFNDEPAVGEEIIIFLLKKYGFMNLHMLQRTLNMGRHRTINAKKSIHKMQQSGVVKKYTISSIEDGPDNDIYTLSEAGIAAYREKNRTKSIYRYDMTNIPYILENLTAAQWHISMCLDGKAKDVALNKRINTSAGITVIPSLTRYWTRFGHNSYVCGIPMTKGKSKKDLAMFVARIVYLCTYFRENMDRYPSVIMVIICESMRQIEDISVLLGSVRETREITLLWSIDNTTTEDNPMSMLYDVIREEGSTTTRLYSL